MNLSPEQTEAFNLLVLIAVIVVVFTIYGIRMSIKRKKWPQGKELRLRNKMNTLCRSSLTPDDAKHIARGAPGELVTFTVLHACKARIDDVDAYVMHAMWEGLPTFIVVVDLGYNVPTVHINHTDYHEPRGPLLKTWNYITIGDTKLLVASAEENDTALREKLEDEAQLAQLALRLHDTGIAVELMGEHAYILNVYGGEKIIRDEEYEETMKLVDYVTEYLGPSLRDFDTGSKS